MSLFYWMIGIPLTLLWLSRWLLIYTLAGLLVNQAVLLSNTKPDVVPPSVL